MKDLESRQRSKVLAAVYILMFAVAAVGDSKFLPSTAKIATLVPFGIAVMILLVTADFKNLRKISGFVTLYGIWLLIIVAYSTVIWILNFETVSYMMRGYSKLVYQVIILLVIFAAAYMFGEKGIHYTFYGLLLGNALIALLYVPSYGIGGVISSVTEFIVTRGEATGYMRRLEIHDITFTYGFFMLYFIYFDRISSKKSRVINTILAGLFFLIGFKRIAIASFLVMLAVGWLLNRFTPRVRYGLMGFALVAAVVGAFVYLVIIKYNVFMLIMNQFGVDVKGRDVLYGYIDKYYKISPGFFGYGFEYVHMMMAEIAKIGGKQFNGMVDIHNDFMRVYIEMGFWGFIGWAVYTLLFQFRWIKHRYSVETVQLFFLCEMYIYFTYMTDNTLFYFFTGMVLRLLPLCYALHIEDESERKLVVENDYEQNRFRILSKRGQESVTLYSKKTKTGS